MQAKMWKLHRFKALKVRQNVLHYFNFSQLFYNKVSFSLINLGLWYATMLDQTSDPGQDISETLVQVVDEGHAHRCVCKQNVGRRLSPLNRGSAVLVTSTVAVKTEQWKARRVVPHIKGKKERKS